MHEDTLKLFENEGYRLGPMVRADGWGELYLATYHGHGTDVLLRHLPRRLTEDPAAWKLIEAEIQVWARLSHPGVLAVLDWGRAAGEAFLVTRRPEGTILEELLSSDNAALDPEATGGSIASAIEAARQWGVLHLGLNPGNVWVGPDGAAAVSDFGLWYVAREFPGVADPDEGFLSPEQIAGEQVSAASDVFSLGVLILAMEAGPDVARAAARGGIPEGIALSRPIARCLSREPAVRYRSAGELAIELRVDPETWRGEDHHDCPLCVLQEEIRANAPGEDGIGRPGSGASRVLAYTWAAVLVLAAMAILTWWYALQ